MSHFSVLVRVPKTVQEHQLNDAVEKLMAPYNENEHRNHFNDIEDECLEKYKNEPFKAVKLANGTIHSRYSDQFYERKDGLFGDKEFKLPEGAVEITLTNEEHYGSFENYMVGWHGDGERDPVKNRYGYWSNPKAKWDWWQIGGRYTGHLSIGYKAWEDKDNYERCDLCRGTGTRYDMKSEYKKATAAGHPVIGDGCNGCSGTGFKQKWPTDFKPVGNYTHIRYLDFKKIEEMTLQSINEFWTEWLEYLDGKKFDAFDGPRSIAMNMGLMDCKNKSELDGTESKVVPWDNNSDRCDVFYNRTKEYVIENYFNYFNPISTWARLSDKGWQDRGDMGWFGCGQDTPESTQQFYKTMNQWIDQFDQDDWLVVVDCHI